MEIFVGSTNDSALELGYMIAPAALRSGVSEALNKALANGLEHLAELDGTGFNTNEMFDHGWLTAHAASRQLFVLRSTGTNTQYLAVCFLRIRDTYHAGVQLYFPGRKDGGARLESMH